MLDADRYEDSRPGYPPSLVGWGLGDAGSGLVVELGAGTGKFSRLVRSRVGNYLAIEPDPAMAMKLVEVVPDMAVVRADAHALPLESGTVAALVAAQSFHCFADQPAQQEMARVLRPDGYLFAVWSVGDGDAAAWVHDYSILLAPSPQAVTEDRDVLAPELAACFSPTRTAAVSSQVAFTWERLRDMTLAHSMYAQMPASRQADVLAGACEVFDRHAAGHPRVVVMPLTTRALIAHRS